MGIHRMMFPVSIDLALSQGGIIRIAHGRRTVKTLRPQLVQQSLQAYPLDKIRICDEGPAEGDEVAGIVPQELIRMFARSMPAFRMNVPE
jgi:hypothetical protein